MSRLAVLGGRLIDPANNRDEMTDLFIEGDRIVAIGSMPENFSPNESIDASGMIVCPGLIDLASRLREPGAEQKGTIASEAKAAVLGGITTVCCLPDTDPVTDEVATVELIKRRATDAGRAKIRPLGALTQGLKGEQLSEISALRRAGCPAMTQAEFLIRDTRVLLRAMQYAASFEIPLILRPQDHWLAADGCVHEGDIATQLGLPAIPAIAETIAIGQILALVRHSGVQVHFSKISSRHSLPLIRAAKSEGLNITADVSINHLYLTEDDLLGFNNECHVMPPLRSKKDREALRQALSDGSIDAICSDHSPHDIDAKLKPFSSAEPGISGFDTFLSLGHQLVEQQVLTWSQLIHLMSARPASLLGLDTGGLGIGDPADVCIFDPQKSWLVSSDSFYSSGKNTPYNGWTLSGRTRHAIVGGIIQRT